VSTTTPDGPAPTRPKKFQRDTSWDELDTAVLPNGTEATKFAVAADQSDASAPVVFKVVFPPGTVVATHMHDCDYCEVILEGSQKVGRTWHHPGDIRIVQAHTAYGPLEAGPEGCTVMVVFRDGHWPAVPIGEGKDEGLHVDVLKANLT